ncbi:hypothetical protein Ancab_023437 [Ancistrocladus abbreviatus]
MASILTAITKFCKHINELAPLSYPSRLEHCFEEESSISAVHGACPILYMDFSMVQRYSSFFDFRTPFAQDTDHWKL